MKASTPDAVATMIRAIDRGAGVVHVPRWYRPVAGLLGVLPSGLLRRFT